MPFYQVPSREHPIYQEWRKWRHICDRDYSPAAAAAKASIERIANHLYDMPCIVGHMIMMDDIQSEEESGQEGQHD